MLFAASATPFPITPMPGVWQEGLGDCVNTHPLHAGHYGLPQR